MTEPLHEFLTGHPEPVEPIVPATFEFGDEQTPAEPKPEPKPEPETDEPKPEQPAGRTFQLGRKNLQFGDWTPGE